MVRDVPLGDVPQLPEQYGRGFQPAAVEVIFRGVCDDCAPRSTQK
jgi:hypothetical protein